MATQKIKIHRYDHPQQVGWEGWIEPDSKSWILFFNEDGAVFYPTRDEDGGIVDPS